MTDKQKVLPCIICGKELSPALQGTEFNQPYGGTVCTSHGQYGSTVFDPMDGSFLIFNICDPCLVAKKDAIRRATTIPFQTGASVEYDEWDPKA